jgi:folate-binding protein YgfZ
MTPLSYLSVLKVSGADANKFLQSQVTAHLIGLQAPKATYSAYCTSKGQVIATLLLAPREDHWLVVVESSLLETLIENLQQFVLREDVQLEALNGHYLFSVDPHDFLVDSVILIEPRTVPIQYAISEMKPPASPESTARWRRSELLFGIPWLNKPSSEKYIPQMLGLDTIGAVSFSKGCYPGQEVIARARHLGEVKRRPQVLDMEGDKAPDVNLPCYIRTASGQVEATLVHCVNTSFNTFTVFTVSALQPADAVRGLEQNGQHWTAKRAFQEHHEH